MIILYRESFYNAPIHVVMVDAVACKKVHSFLFTFTLIYSPPVYDSLLKQKCHAF